jgi:RNA methyltransferase, TrmH family
MHLERSPVTSPRNPALQRIRKAVRAGRETEEGWIIAEGPHLLAEATRSQFGIAQVLLTSEARKTHARLLERLGAEIIEVSDRALASIADTQKTQGVISALRAVTWSWADLICYPASVVILDGIQDPGNAGTVVRSAEAFGASGVIFVEGSVRVSNGKFLRASAGSIFRLPFLEGVRRDQLIGLLKGSQITLYGLSASASVAFTEVSFLAPFAVAVGAEGGGLSPEIAGAAQQISIPTTRVESLNAAVSSSLALFEASRQRRSR